MSETFTRKGPADPVERARDNNIHRASDAGRQNSQRNTDWLKKATDGSAQSAIDATNYLISIGALDPNDIR